jgi:CMP-N-acetylneuraminic acid synthetase
VTEKYCALIAVRKGSQRIKNKNIKDFCGTSLLEIKVKQALRSKLIDKVVVSSDCDEMLSISKSLGALTHKREDYFCSSSVEMNEVYENLAKNIDCDHVVYLHVTSPLLTDRSLNECITRYKNRKEQYDSLATVETVKKYLWNKNVPVNYDPNNHPRSQDLPRYDALNFAVNIISKENMVKNRNIVGKKFIAFSLEEIESIDVDNQFDFEIAEYFYKKLRKEKNLK